ncbi:MAG: peptidylprolyl isomerase [Candidatus Roizmanbacteria bacterium]|nr:peptidylprolyl isomerase [Candidatus Roizmanbacteria bacterium]
MKKEVAYLLLAGSALIVIVLFGWNNLFSQKSTTTSQTSQIPVEPTEEMTKKNTKQPPMTIDVNKTYTATVTTTEGDITINLDTKDTPITVNNFVYLAKKGFYANTIFHRVIKGFMIQGGDPSGDGTGGPGYTFADEPIAGSYTRGTVAMANSGPNTNGSQFFIMHADTELPKSYVIFGHVLEGMDVVDKIATAPMQTGGEGSSPVNPVHIQSVAIDEK